LAGLESHEAIILAGDNPTGNHTISCFVLKYLDNFKIKVAHRIQKRLYPYFERFPWADQFSARCNGEIFGYEMISGCGISFLPDFLPKLWTISMEFFRDTLSTSFH
jgi:hypothetical protein